MGEQARGRDGKDGLAGRVPNDGKPYTVNPEP